MNSYSSIFTKSSTKNQWLYFISAITLSLAILLSLLSWLELCTSTCASTHQYTLYGLKFVSVGFIVLPVILVLHLLSKTFKPLEIYTGWLICSSLGAEVMFIYLQKYVIKSWCPICLAIAISLSIAWLAYLSNYFENFKIALKRKNKGQIMNIFYKGLIGTVFFISGFLFAFLGVGFENQLEAVENSLKEKIALGDSSKPIAVYVFTDWRCPACRSLEPLFDKMIPIILTQATLIFVDDPIHPESLNFTPYNVSFLVNNKAQYLPLRNSLMKLSQETTTPTDTQVENLAKNLGTTYTQLNYSDIAVANLYFSELVDKFNVEGTPTVVIANKKNHKNRKLGGVSEITEENITKAMDILSKDKIK